MDAWESLLMSVGLVLRIKQWYKNLIDKGAAYF
jgi:hypothetical protein